MPEAIVVGLGGNVGGSAKIVERFVAVKQALAFYGSVRAASIYRSAPVGGIDQPAYLNSALLLAFERVQPVELLATLQELERILGRDRATETRWGPRPIDLDILVWGERTIRTASLVVPHAQLARRRFALAPLVELVGADFVVPGAGRAGALLAAVAEQDVVEIAAFRR